MLKNFEIHIESKRLCKKNNSILVATSGGVDSAVLINLFINAGYKIAIAHCNFKLRDEESDGDEIFVKKLGKDYGVKVFSKSFDTVNYAKNNKLSIEMAARELRYDWFYELANKFNFDYIATGHHINDSIETFILNFTRGCGLKGVTGISAKNGKIIRPLLFATRESIEKYAANQKLTYRTDSSNMSDIYMRNIIRKQIVPLLKKINPAFEKTMDKNLNNLNEAYDIYKSNIENVKSQTVQYKTHKTKISIADFSKLSNKETFMFEIIKEYGFNSSQADKITKNIGNESGKMFYSKTHQLLIDRDFVKIEALERKEELFIAHSLEQLNKLPIKIKAEIIDKKDFTLQKDKNIAFVDADLISFPITIRKWKNGDFFFPFGMDKKKKLSDFFIDQKTDRIKKHKIWVFESCKQIFWIAGMRTDNRFRVTEKSDKILKLTIKPNI